MIKPSPLASRYLAGLSGIEIGGSAHNPFALDRCWNVDWTADWGVNKSAAQEQRRAGCEPLRVDVVAEGDHLPFRESSLDYVLSSHVLEHFWDPVGALKGWIRVLCALFDHLNIQLVIALDEDDKVGNGFCIVGRVKCQAARFPKGGHVALGPGKVA